MTTDRANRIFRWGSILVVLVGLIMGARATGAAMALVVAFLAVFLICDGTRICINEFRRGERLSAFLVGTSYLAGCLVLLVGLYSLICHIPDHLNFQLSQVLVLAILMLLFVFFVGLLREGISAVSKNLRRKRYSLVVLNLAVLLGVGIGIMIGGGKMAAAFFR